MENGKWKMEGASPCIVQPAPALPIYHFPFSIFHSPRTRRAFTLTEIMVVIVIIVLMLSMAMPVFRMMNGSRSEESASNQIAAMLGAARSQAIGLQQPTGVAFFPDSTGRYQMAIVQRPIDSGFQNYIMGNPYNRWTYVSYTPVLGGPTYHYVAIHDIPAATAAADASTAGASTAYWCTVDTNVADITPNSSAEPLPMGVGVQLINDWGSAPASIGSTTPKSDAYLSTGIIFFDSQGRLSNRQFSITQQGFIGSSMAMTSHNYPEWGTTNSATPAAYAANLYSSFGLVLFDKDAFLSQGFDTIDPTYSPHQKATYTTTPNEQTEESWLDQNATPLLINRFNGTLVKGE